MNFSLYSEYPAWLYVLCLAGGAMYAYLLYRKEKRFDETPKWARIAMPVLRFLAVACIAFFLLSPLLKHVSRTVEKPIVIFAQDNSESVVAGKDSVFYRAEYPQNIKDFISALANRFDTNTYSFGDQIRAGLSYNYKDKLTDIASLFREIETRYSNRNVGAVIVASDGLYNKGENPVYTASKNNFPVYTIALGDTTVRKDLAISKVLSNRIAYLGNNFPIEIQVIARRLSGEKPLCTVSKGNTVLFTQSVPIKGNDFYLSIPVQLEAKETGLQRYTVRLSGIEGEASLVNNTKDIFIDVLDGRQRILILGEAPHPDIAAVKNSLESNENYEVNSFLASDFSEPVKGYNLVVLHQLPSSKNPIQKIIAELEKEKIPLLFVIGSQTSLPAFNAVQPMLSLPASGGKINDALPVVSKDFGLFTLSSELKNFSSRLSPLQCPFGNYKTLAPASVLFSQKIGLVETAQPMLLFAQSGDQKTGVVCGEGIWRWRLQDFSEHGDHAVFNELIGKTAQYLSARVDKSFFRVLSKNSFYENEPVELEAELYNDSYELINNPEVSLWITNQEGKKFAFSFSRTTNAYRLNAGLFPAGNYRYEASVKSGAKTYTEKGEFTIAPLQAETTHLVADHPLLYSLAAKSGGAMVNAHELDKLKNLLLGRDDIKPVSHSEKKLSDLINLKWIFFLLLSLISLEWFARKINGAY